MELMAKKPYTDITINDICEKMGTSRKSFYHFFKSKQGCLYAMIDRYFYGFMDYELPQNTDLKGYPPRLIKQMLYQYETREAMELLIRNDMFGMLIERLIFLVMENTGNRDIQKDAATIDSIVFYYCGVMGVRYHWHTSGYKRSMYEVADSIMQLATPEMLEKW